MTEYSVIFFKKQQTFNLIKPCIVHKRSFVSIISIFKQGYASKSVFCGIVIQFLWAKAVKYSSQHLRPINKSSLIKTNLGTSLGHTGALGLFYLDSKNI